MITRYESLREFSAALPARTRSRLGEAREYWNGDQTYQESKVNLFQGDPKALRASDRVFEQIESDGLALETQEFELERVGFVPCVPAYLAGDPESLFAAVEVQRETAPIRIFCSVVSSGGFEASAMARRGAAVLALARKLTTIRPVELYAYGELGSDQDDGACIVCIRLDASPLDLTTGSYVLANPAFSRQLCFAWGYDQRVFFNGDWAWGQDPRNSVDAMRAALGAEEHDLVIPGAYWDDPLTKDPLGWVNEKLRRFAGTLEEGTI